MPLRVTVVEQGKVQVAGQETTYNTLDELVDAYSK